MPTARTRGLARMTDPSPEFHPAHQATGLRRYAYVWRMPGAPTLLIGGVIGRLPVGMVTLAIVLFVEHAYGSYTPAGVAAGLLGIANAVAAPVFGRLADRITPTPVLLGTVAVYAAALLAMVAAVGWRAPIGVVYGVSVLVGGSMPPLSAALRSIWTDMTVPPRHRLREPALALDTVVFEMVFVIGPLIVSMLAALSSPAWALVAAVVLAAVGTTAVALGSAARSWRPHPHRGEVTGLGALSAPGMPTLLAVAGALAFSFGSMGVALPAYVTRQVDDDGRANLITGVLLAVWSIGSFLGGLWFGSRDFRWPLPTLWGVALAGVALGSAALVIVPNMVWMGVALMIGGCTIAPALTVENMLVARVAPTGMLNEAYNWVSTVVYAVGAVGSAVTGFAVDHGGPQVAFGLSAVIVGAAAVIAWHPRSVLRRVLAG